MTLSQTIYLDNHTTTHPSVQAVAKMIAFLTERWGVPSAPHQRGQQLFPAMEEALKGIYALLGARENDTILFTSSAAEGINHAILSTYFDVTIPTGKNQFMTSAIDEAPAIMAIDRLKQLSCVDTMVFPNANGLVTASAIAEMITPRTALISLSWANGLTGVVNPIKEIAFLCKERGILFHVDASHVLGKIFTDWDQVPADFLTFNGDSIHAPTGTGALFIREGLKVSPFILGGNEQGGLRAGNFSVAGLVALGHAASEALDTRDLICTEVARLRSHLEKQILENIPNAVIFFRDQERLPNCTAIAFPNVVNEALLYALNRKGVYASIGGGTHQQIGIILTASGIDTQLAQSAISFSLSKETTEEEIDRAVEIITECVIQLRRIGHQWALEPERGLC